MGKIIALEAKMAKLKMELLGDASLSKYNFPTKPSISDRVDNIVMGIWSSTSSPTGTMKESLKVASGLFQSLLAEVIMLSEQDIAVLEKELEAANAPYTPGRLPLLQEDED